LEKKLKSFHFQEIDWLICFPDTGNEDRKYLYYSVQFIDRKNKKDLTQTILADIVESPLFESAYPHTVGFFRGQIESDGTLLVNFLELRIIRCIEDFWKFLNDLNL
jgi:hypothetical protein